MAKRRFQGATTWAFGKVPTETASREAKATRPSGYENSQARLPWETEPPVANDKQLKFRFNGFYIVIPATEQLRWT